MKDRPLWEAVKGSITWRKYDLRNMSRVSYREKKKSPASKPELGLLSGGRVRGWSFYLEVTYWMSGKKHVLGNTDRGTKTDLRKCSQTEAGREAAKHRHKVKKVTITAPSQEGQSTGGSQQQERMAHHAKYLWSRSREMSKQQPLHAPIREPSRGQFQ